MYGPRMIAEFDRGKGPITVELGPVRDEDAGAKLFTKWFSDNRIRLFLSMSYPITESSEKDYLKKKSTDENSVAWNIFVENKLIGSIGLDLKKNKGDSKAELGIMIGDKNYWSKGIAQVIESMVLEYGFTNVLPGGLHKIYAGTFVGNTNSYNALKKIGFKEVGVQKEDAWVQGRWVDSWWGEILQKEWQEIRESVFKSVGIKKFTPYPDCEDEGFEPIIVK